MESRSWYERLGCAFVRFWQDMLDSLNTDGGHILILAVAITVGPKLGLPEQYRAEMVGGLLMYLKMAGSNKTRRDRLIPESEVSTSTAQVTEIASVQPIKTSEVKDGTT